MKIKLIRLLLIVWQFSAAFIMNCYLWELYAFTITLCFTNGFWHFLVVSESVKRSQHQDMSRRAAWRTPSKIATQLRTYAGATLVNHSGFGCMRIISAFIQNNTPEQKQSKVILWRGEGWVEVIASLCLHSCNLTKVHTTKILMIHWLMEDKELSGVWRLLTNSRQMSCSFSAMRGFAKPT